MARFAIDTIGISDYLLIQHYAFTRDDDVVPDRFFEEPLTVRDQKGAVLTRDQFKTMMGDFYAQRGWDLETSKPGAEELKSLKLAA